MRKTGAMRVLRHLSWIVTVPLALLAMSFAVSNRHAVSIGLWPLPDIVELPAFLLVLGPMLLGFLAGGFTVWLDAHRHRRAARLERARADRLEKEIGSLRSAPVTASPPLASPAAAS